MNNNLLLLLVFTFSFLFIFLTLFYITRNRRKIDNRLSNITVYIEQEKEEREETWLKGLYNKYETLFIQANLKLKYEEFKKIFLLMLLVYVVIIFVSFKFFNALVGFVFILIFSFVYYKIPNVVLQYFKNKRIKELNKQKKDILTIMLSCSYSQLPLDKTFKTIAENIGEPASEIFTTAYQMLNLNWSYKDVLNYLKKNFDSEDFNFLLSTYEMWLEYQGSLSATYKIVMDTLRNKEEIEKEIEKISDSAKMFIFLLIGITVLMTYLIYNSMGQDYINYLKHPLGQIGIILTIVSLLLGMFFINKLKNSIKY